MLLCKKNKYINVVKRSQYDEYEKSYEPKTTLGITFDATCSQEVTGSRNSKIYKNLYKITRKNENRNIFRTPELGIPEKFRNPKLKIKGAPHFCRQKMF